MTDPTNVDLTIKRDFGSFHSSNVEELIYQSDATYIAPKLAVKFDASKLINYDFGTSEIKKELFCLTDEFTFINHGAFGLTFRPVLNYVAKWKEYAETQPLKFYDREIMPLLVDLIRNLSKNVFNCKPHEIALIENCTFAFNSIFNALKLKQGEKIFIWSTTYGVYKKILREKCQTENGVLIEENVEYPINDEVDLNERFLGKLEKALEVDSVDRKIKYVFVDHIPSNQPFLVPIVALSRLCKLKRPDICFIVDGAHTLGSFNIFQNMDLKNIDYFFTNCHKWFSGPKGTAILYKNEFVNIEHYIKPAVRSHGCNAGFNSEFIWSGLRDYSAYLGLYANLDLFTNYLGGFARVIEYCTNLTREAGEYLKKAWSTSVLVNEKLCSTMICVKLPDLFVQRVCKLNKEKTEKLNYDNAEIVQNFFYYQHKIEVPIKCVQNDLYVRISCHIYNNMKDYVFLANVVLEIIKS
jgi:isopenicillin-N epimerase